MFRRKSWKKPKKEPENWLIDRLPNELIVNIMEKCDYKSSRNLAKVCDRFTTLYEQNLQRMPKKRKIPIGLEISFYDELIEIHVDTHSQSIHIVLDAQLRQNSEYSNPARLSLTNFLRSRAQIVEVTYFCQDADFSILYEIAEQLDAFFAVNKMKIMGQITDEAVICLNECFHQPLRRICFRDCNFLFTTEVLEEWASFFRDACPVSLEFCLCAMNGIPIVNNEMMIDGLHKLKTLDMSLSENAFNTTYAATIGSLMTRKTEMSFLRVDPIFFGGPRSPFNKIIVATRDVEEVIKSWFEGKSVINFLRLPFAPQALGDVLNLFMDPIAVRQAQTKEKTYSWKITPPLGPQMEAFITGRISNGVFRQYYLTAVPIEADRRSLALTKLKWHLRTYGL